ncbi:unnamed protein product [marine sediment metagenome]|uniref:Uncharacterized protein n=1 Tax=marine sediment metagenome TaxID=412755 RepID=X1F296_9ZZZZ
MITIEEGIAGLEDLLVDDPHFDPEHRRECVKLGVEALKGIRSCRQYPECPFNDLLPGEEKE